MEYQLYRRMREHLLCTINIIQHICDYKYGFYEHLVMTIRNGLQVLGLS